jgi:cyclohexanone monooxygenase
MATQLDMLIVGAGWAGMYLLYRARRLGLKVRIFEACDDVGGTWCRNRYPGLRCDVESTEYSFSFSEELQQEWEWTERFASQPEILRYANRVADKFDLRRDIQFGKRVLKAQFDDARGHWTIFCDDGEPVSATYYVMASGCLSVPKDPDLPGLTDFKGEVYHTADWPHELVDFRGKRVGVIGTGSSGIQVIPIIAEQAVHLYVYQRTPSYSLPARNGPLAPEFVARVKSDYAKHRKFARESFGGLSSVHYEKSALEVSAAECHRVYQELYERGAPFAFLLAFTDILVNEEANKTAADFVASTIRQRVKDPDIAEKLIPQDQYFGTRRLCIDTGYYETFNRDNVSLIDVRTDPLRRISDRGIATQNTDQALDCIVLATGYHAMTGALLAVDIRGSEGRSLREKWADGPHTYLGLMTAGFPNFFMVTGPGSPSVLGNVVLSIEQHVDWIADCVSHMRANGRSRIVPQQSSEDAWVAHADEIARHTLFPKGNSWYLFPNVPGKPRTLMPYVGGVGPYRRICEQVAASGYEGFDMT